MLIILLLRDIALGLRWREFDRVQIITVSAVVTDTQKKLDQWFVSLFALKRGERFDGAMIM